MGTEKSYQYYNNGQIHKITDFNGNETVFDYDNGGRLASKTYSDGESEHYTYDGVGNILTAVNPSAELEYIYDPLGRLSKATDHFKEQVIDYVYDPSGNRTEMSWLEGERVINYTYGNKNELLAVTDPEGDTTTFEYDQMGRETARELPNGVVTRTSYDPAGRITSMKNESSQRWGWGNDISLKSFAYLYNAAGERTYQIEEDGQITAYEYDGAGRIENVYYPFISGKKSEDFNERLELGLYPEYVQSDNSGWNRGRHGNSSNGAFQFDISDPYIENYNSNEFEETLEGFLNDKDHIYKEYRNPGFGGNWNIEPGEGAAEFAVQLDIPYETKQALEDIYSEITLGYSPGLDTEQWMWTETFTYDGFNNRESKSNGWGKIDYTYNPANEIVTAGNRHYEHDANGNPVKETLGDMEKIYTYNYADRITEIHSEVPGFHGQSMEKGIRYEYDPFGRRISRTEYEENGMAYWNMTDESSRNYLYDGLGFDVLAEFDGWDSNSFGWGGWNNRNSGTAEYIKANGNIVSRTDFNESSSRWGGYPQWENKEYYSEDLLGSVIMLTDSWGNMKESYTYDAFGNRYGDKPFGHYYGSGWMTGTKNQYGYNGKRFDSDAGLSDYGFRDYSSLLGRFTTVDPIKSGSNWYVYVGNDPVNMIDLWGLEESDSQFVDQLGSYGSPWSQPTLTYGNLYSIYQTPAYDPTNGMQFVGESLRPEYGVMNALGTGSGFAGTSRITTYRPYVSSSISNWELETIKPRSDDAGLQPGTGEPLYSWQVEKDDEVARSFAEENPELVKQALEESKPSIGQKILEFITTILVPRN